MAKRHGKKKTTHRRKVSGMSSQQTDGLAQAAGAAVGAGAGWYIYTTQKSIQDNLMGLLQAGLGVGLLMFTKQPLLKGVGLGLVASAAIIEGESFGLLSGVTNLPSSGNLKIAGYESVRQLGAAPGMYFPKPAGVGSPIARKYAGGTYRR
jgi:hypothetical protein